MMSQLLIYRRHAALVMMLLTIFPIVTLPATAQEGSRYFRETGFIVEEPILSAFNNYGGVPVIGLPISAAMETMCEEIPCLIQWFERSRIEVHRIDGKPYRGRIGADYLAQQGTPWTPGDGNNPGGCQVFSETGHSVCGAFLDGWRRYGGLARIGLPLTPPQPETYVDGGTDQAVTFMTQWYERAALEDHDNQGIMLRLLGSQTYPNWAERLLAELINAERTRVGLPLLIWHVGLARVARLHSSDVARHGQLTHIGSDGRDPGSRTATLGLPGSITGEVMAFELSPVGAVAVLMNSTAHKAVILDPGSTHFGVGYGVVLGKTWRNTWPATIWTVDFWTMQ